MPFIVWWKVFLTESSTVLTERSNVSSASWISSGWIAVSRSRAAIEVCLYASSVYQRHLFCMVRSGFTKLLFGVTLSFPASQTYASYSSVRRITAEYSSLKCRIDGF